MRNFGLFQCAPTAMWQVDSVALQEWLDTLRAGGVTEIRPLLESDPQQLVHGLSLVRVRRVNPAAVALFEADNEQQLLEGVPWILATVPLAVFMDVVVARWNGEQFFHSSTLICTLKGRQLCTLVGIAVPKVSGQLDLSQVVVTFADVTEVNRTQQTLRESEQFHRTLLNTMPVGVILTDPLGVVTYISPRARQTLGLPSDNGEGIDLLDWVDPEHHDIVQEQIERALVDQAAQPSVECQMLKHGGMSMWAEVAAAPFLNAEGQLEGVLIVCQDVTVRRQAQEALREREELLRSLADNLPDTMVYQMDEHLGQPRFTYVSASVERLHEISLEAVLADASLLYRQVLPEYFHGLRVAEAKAYLTKSSFRYEMECRLPSGRMRWLELVAAPRMLPGGHLVWDGVELDITERKNTEAALRNAMAAAERANQAKSQFLASMSHELRTPMNAIIGMTDLALSEELPPVARDYLQTAKESADLLLELVNEILDFSRIEAGRFELESTPFHLHKTVEQVVRTLGPRASEKGLELLCDLPPEVPDRLVGDPLRLRQILMNLVGNAIKFTPRGEVVLRVRNVESSESEVESPEAEHTSAVSPEFRLSSPDSQPSTLPFVLLEFSVSDTGIGILPEDLERIFAPFTQADASTTRQFGGFGLGLAISRKLVELMGGRIRVESQAGQGSTFYFTARLQMDAPQDSGADLPDPETLRGISVLVVAESAASRRHLQQTLAGWSMRPETASNVAEALLKIHQEAASGLAFRLVLADAVLAGVDGFTLAEWLHREPRLTGPVILMAPTADDRFQQRRRCEKLQITCIDKPVAQSDLLRAIARTLGIQWQAASEERALPARANAPARALRVLLAEDTPANQKLGVRLLSKRGHHVEVAENGQQALEMLQRGKFDVVLMDVQMPVMDGFQATAAIRALSEPAHARVPIVAMTAHALKGDAERCLAAGMDAYVSKPIRAESVLSLIERLGAGGSPSIPELAIPGLPATAATGPARREESPRPPVEVFDFDEALRMCLGDYDLLQDFIGSLDQESDLAIQGMRLALRRGEGQEVYDAAHRLKNVVVYLGSASVAETLARLEQIGRHGDLAGAAEAIDELEQKLGQLKSAIAAHENRT